MPPLIDKDKCIGCGTCVDICPLQVFVPGTPDAEGRRVPVAAHGDECWHCNSCVLDCKAHAVRLRIPAPYMMLHVDASTLKRNGE